MKNRIISSRAHRILRHCTNFHLIKDISLDTEVLIKDIHLIDGEELIGVYENSFDENASSILVSNLGIRVITPIAVDFVDYQFIDKVEIPAGVDKGELNRLFIRLKDGQTKTIFIGGGHAKFRDIYEFIHFLDRVKDDVGKETL
jgi:hypothetical protein